MEKCMLYNICIKTFLINFGDFYRLLPYALVNKQEVRVNPYQTEFTH